MLKWILPSEVYVWKMPHLQHFLLISEAFPKKILNFPSFVLAQLLWKGKMKAKQSFFSEGFVQTTGCPMLLTASASLLMGI